jgi:hypothetical protein
MLAKILHALIDGANVTDNLRGELHSLADLVVDEIEQTVGSAISRALGDAGPGADVSRETPPPADAPAAPVADVSRETLPADDASHA